jgi:catechol 2,3-dioxygenase-like lactoylglutathione lyase family enzyme
MLHHVDVHVRDLAAGRALLHGLAEHVGYSRLVDEPNFVGYETAGGGRPRIGLILDPDHRPGSTRLAFAVATRAQVDVAARIATDRGARAIEGPAVHTEYGAYYAVFFEDADGNRYEVMADEAATRLI